MLDLKLLREGIMPRVSTVCLATTTAAVRTQCFQFMSFATPRMGPKDVDGLTGTAAKVREFPYVCAN
jgi:hypothetical protein